MNHRIADRLQQTDADRSPPVGATTERGCINDLWDAGSYQVESEYVVMIQAASEKQHHYRYRLDGDRLTFVDDDGCAFAYQRVEAVNR